jgi:alkanesulfonate monooxygenase SsuD/methylene tetrahydromethanopterin reductase-like flavin-dependent oxidoreductase (luciferase family)
VLVDELVRGHTEKGRRGRNPAGRHRSRRQEHSTTSASTVGGTHSRYVTGLGSAVVSASTRTANLRAANVSDFSKTPDGSAAEDGRVKVGIGLPAGVPGADMSLLGFWAEEAEAAGFDAVGVFDRLVSQNLDPLTALAAAAARTSRIELATTVTNVCWRANPVLLAKQLWSVDRLSGGRLVAGLGMGGWPADYESSGVALKGRGKLFDASLAAIERDWSSRSERPRVLVGGTVERSYARAARALSDGWVSPLFGLETLRTGVAGVERAWRGAGRSGTPRIMTGRYFSLGPGAEEVAKEYVRHYYGPEYFAAALADTLTSPEQVEAELRRLSEVGCTDVLLFPCSGELEQISLLVAALRRSGDLPRPDPEPQPRRNG